MSDALPLATADPGNAQTLNHHVWFTATRSRGRDILGLDGCKVHPGRRAASGSSGARVRGAADGAVSSGCMSLIEPPLHPSFGKTVASVIVGAAAGAAVGSLGAGLSQLAAAGGDGLGQLGSQGTETLAGDPVEMLAEMAQTGDQYVFVNWGPIVTTQEVITETEDGFSDTITQTVTYGAGTYLRPGNSWMPVTLGNESLVVAASGGPDILPPTGACVSWDGGEPICNIPTKLQVGH